MNTPKNKKNQTKKRLGKKAKKEITFLINLL